MSLETLKPAVLALRSQIEVLSPDASAEDLAYLGSAVERIAGHATVFDVMQASTDAQAEISTAHADVMVAIQSANQSAQDKIALAETGALSRINAAQPIRLAAIHAAALSF